MKLKQKVRIGSFAVIIFVFSSTVFTCFKISSLENATHWVDHTYKVLIKADSVLAAAADMETGMRGFLLAGKNEFLDPYRSGRERFNAGIKDLQETVSDNPPQVKLLGDIHNTISEWQRNVTEPMIEKRKQVGTSHSMNDIAMWVGEAKGKIYFDSFREKIKTFRDKEAALLSVRKEKARTTASIMTTTVIAGGIILALICFFIIFLANRGLHFIAMTAKMLREISANGDLTQRITFDGQNEIGDLVDDFNQLCEKIRTTMLEIAHHADTLSVSSTNLKQVAETTTASSVSMQDQSKGTHDAVNTLSSNLDSVTENAKEVSNNINSVASAIHEVDTSINDVSNNCSAGSEKSMLAETKAENTVQAMRELEESAAKIGSVINTINDIAGKTDLLALNATIEAASAGEAGKGFAVVANEVKELATQTAHATKEIGQLIQQMQSKTGVAVEATADIGTLIDGLNQMMQSISSSISQQSSATREISRTVEGTSRSAINMSSKIEESSDLSTNVANNIDELGQKSVSVKNDSQASLDQSQALSQMSDDLKHLIHQFKVEA